MLTPEQIEALAAMEGTHATERAMLQARHSNDREELLTRQQSEREQLAGRLGLAGAPGGSTGLEDAGGRVIPASRRPIAVRPGAGRGGG